MATPRDIINRSLKTLGILAQGETATAEQMADGLVSLNDMLDSWSTENLHIYKYVTEEFNFVGGQISYQMGSGLDFDTTRPIEIINLTFKDNAVSPANELPIKIMPQEQYQYQANKENESIYPTHVYINYLETYAELKFWPRPAASKAVSITSYKPLTTYASLSTNIELPPGYLVALRYNLAIEQAPEYNIEPPSTVVMRARETKANIKRQNKKYLVQRSEISSLIESDTFDIYKG
jgi:uncharacterized membrane protein